jgi:hypothetical protein
VVNTLDVFAKLDHVGAEILVKTLYPVVGKSADYNFVETAKFVAQVSQASETNGAGMQRLAAKLTNIDPSVRQAFATQTEVVYQRAVLRRSDFALPLAPSSPAAVATGESETERAVPASGSSALLEPILPRRHALTLRR